jgi:hypothetical protein
MIARNIERLRRFSWTWRQPLTCRPVDLNSPISDLFVWRNSNEWQTSFDLMDIPGLFGEGEIGRDTGVTLVLFDQDGRQFSRQEIFVQAAHRRTIDLTPFIPVEKGAIGTFAIFHKSVPSVLNPLGTFIAERGYVSYRYLQAPLRSYVHGNLDAIAQCATGNLQLLGCSSLRRREYRLQYALVQGAKYELGLVNPTPVVIEGACKLVSAHDGKMLSTQAIKLAPGGVQVIVFQSEVTEPARVVIESRMIMARPLVFHIQNLKLDVFHG